MTDDRERRARDALGFHEGVGLEYITVHFQLVRDLLSLLEERTADCLCTSEARANYRAAEQRVQALEQAYGLADDAWWKAQHRIKALEEDNARLRDYLRGILAANRHSDPATAANAMADIAAAALAPAGKESND